MALLPLPRARVAIAIAIAQLLRLRRLLLDSPEIKSERVSPRRADHLFVGQWQRVNLCSEKLFGDPDARRCSLGLPLQKSVFFFWEVWEVGKSGEH